MRGSVPARLGTIPRLAKAVDRAPGLLQRCSPGERADLSRVPERPDSSALGPRGTETKFPGAAFSRTPTGSVRVVPEEGAFLEQLVPREAGPAKMIQAILVFNNHGKPRLVRFYQRFVSAARPAMPLRNTRAIPSLRPAAALSSISGSGTVHDPPPAPPSSFLNLGFSVFCDTFPWVLGTDAVHSVPH